ncbi:ABC transporter family protein [Acanthocheilonema viteae]
MMTTVLNEINVLECRNISNIRTIIPSKWYNRTSSKVTAQFLKEISIIVQSGEIHGIVGNAGSGKTTLLRIIAGRYSGKFTGTITLNQQEFTRQMFDSICAFVNFNQKLIETITVHSMLKFQAALMVRGLNNQEIKERINSLLREFDLVVYHDILIGDLNEAARRRLLLCMRLINDPILIILDEPSDGINALCNYQLMNSLSLYIRRTGAMVIVAVRLPRSNLYQLFDRITILFYGEIIYSGTTKELPLYFRQIGFPCPINENPAIYYLSLATTDRETTERYRKTQEQALKLIDLFKSSVDLQLHQSAPQIFHHPIRSTKPLCFHGRPHCCYQFFILFRRSLQALNSSAHILLLRLLLLPLLTLLICSCSVPFLTSNKWWSPQDRAALLVIYSTLFSIVSIFITVLNESIVCGQSQQDVMDGIYSRILNVLSFSLASAPSDLFAFTSSIIIIIIWHFYSVFSANWNYIWNLILPLWCCYQYYQILVLIVIFYTKNTESTVIFLIELCFGSIVCAGSFFIAPRTFLSANDWRHILMYINFHRYVLSFTNFKFIGGAKAGNCILNETEEINSKSVEQFCSFPDGPMVLCF